MKLIKEFASFLDFKRNFYSINLEHYLLRL